MRRESSSGLFRSLAGNTVILSWCVANKESRPFIKGAKAKNSVNLKSYISKQIRYSIGNIPSVPLSLALLFVLTAYGHVWYVVSFAVSWFIGVGVNFNMQRLLGVIVIERGKGHDYLSKVIRFYMGSAPLIFIGDGALYGLTEYAHVFYMVSSVLSLIATTIIGMAIQMLSRVVKTP
jgi:putative flippase GtrA